MRPMSSGLQNGDRIGNARGEHCPSRRVVRRTRGEDLLMRLPRTIRRPIERLGPYPSLLLLAVPLALAEPLKLATIFICGSGHWLTGLAGILCAYAISILVVERLFKIVKPKLLILPWFAAIWTWFVSVRGKVFRWLRAK